MKTLSRVAVLSIVVVFVLLALLFFRKTAAPESSIIAGQRNKLEASQDKQRMETDHAYADEVRSKLRFLDYRMAVAYNNENKPEAAISILEKLINDENAKIKEAMQSSHRYLEQALYYESLQESYLLKNDEAAAEKAGRSHDELMAKAGAAKKQERLQEEKSTAK